MKDREKVIDALEACSFIDHSDCSKCYLDGPGFGFACRDQLMRDALALLKKQTETINDLYNRYNELCEEIRQKYEGDDVCGLCQYDGAYVGESGDWMNECPGFETNECFCMKNSIREMCGQPLVEEP